MLLKGADEKVRKHLEILKREVNTSNKVISDIMNFSKISTLALEDTDINSLIEVTFTRIEIPRIIKLDIELGEGIPDITADREQIAGVIINLAQDAIQAMTE